VGDAMEIAKIPFHRLIGIRGPRSGEAAMLVLDDQPDLHNHLGTIHASAQYALAEACSGALLLERLGDLASTVVPVLRRGEVKYRRPARGTLYASAALSATDEERVRSELATKGRAMVEIAVQVADAAQAVVLTATLGWYLQSAEGSAAQR
jgi:acyl-coenzyme A thioesterase PaaI-like protein